MIFVQCLTPDQTVYLACQQGIHFIGQGQHSYLMKLVHEATGKEHVVLPIKMYENERITFLRFSTAYNNPVGAEVLLSDPGRYAYYIYQNYNAVNLDPALCIGLVTQGFMEAILPQTYYETPTFNTPSDYIYNG